MSNFVAGLIVLFGLVLLVASIVLLILVLHYRKKANRYARAVGRMDHFIKWMHAQKRISDYEYKVVTQDPGSAPPAQSSAERFPSPATQSPFVPLSASRVESLGTEQSESTASVSRQTLSDASADRLPGREKKSFNAMNILLIIGVMLIILAGAVFVTTTWHILPPVVRIVVVCSFSAIFFIASAVADKALGIPKTALSFYAIASVFLPISALAVGFFELVGPYFSLSGDGRYWVFFAASAVLGAACFFGARKYRYAIFAEATLYCLTSAYICMLAAFDPDRAWFVVFLYLYAALLIFIGHLIRKNPERELPLDYIFRRIPGFAVINSLAIAVIGVLLPTFGLPAGIPAILLSPFFLLSIFRGKNIYAGTIPFAILLTTGLLRLYTGEHFIGYVWLAVAGVVVLAVVGTLSIFPEKMRKWFTVVTVVFLTAAYALQFFEALNRSGSTVLLVAATVVLLVALLYVAYRNKERWVLLLAPFIAVSVIIAFVMLFENYDLPFGSMLAILSGIFFAGSAIADKKFKLSPRTPVSDILFSLLCLFGGFVSIDTGWGKAAGNYSLTLADGLVPFATLLSILAFIMLEKRSVTILPKSSSVAGGFIPVVFFLCSFPVYLFAEEFIDASWVFVVFYALTALLGIWAWINTESLHLPRMLHLGAYGTMIALGVFLRVFFGAIGEDYMVPVVAWIAVAYLCACVLLKTIGKSFSEKSAGFAAFSFTAGASVYVALMLSAQLWAGVDSVFFTVLIPAIAAFAFCAIAGAFLLIDKKMPAALGHIGRVGVYGLSLFSAILIVSVAFREEVAWIAVIYLFAIMSLAYRYLSGTSVRVVWFDMLLIYGASFVWIAHVDDSEREWFGILIMVIVYIAAAAFGRWRHAKVFAPQTEASTDAGKLADWPTLTSVLSAIALLSLGEYARWVALILLGLYALSFLRRTASESGDRIAATIAALCLLLSIWIQPLVEIPDIIILEFNLLALIGFFVLIDRLIWNNETSHTLVFASSCVSLAIAGIAATVTGDVTDSLIVGTASFLMLVFSFLLRRKRWFITAEVTLIILVLYMTRTFWATLSWWVYLLLVGLVLIGLAAANEISKQNGERLSEKVKHLFRDWD